MEHKSIEKVAVVIPNLNGEDYLADAIDSILQQSRKCTLIVVENASTDRSRDILASYKDKVITLFNEKNKGFAGGVNTGIDYCLNNHFDAVALFNNDAVADRYWLKSLVEPMDQDRSAGIVTGQLRLRDGNKIDSTGEIYTTWGLPYPRGRDEPTKTTRHTKQEYVFGASGGGSLYRTAMFRAIGTFDNDFFAYYEDTDISFRAQLAGWKVVYTPRAIANHRQGATSKKLPGFTVYQTFKNLPILFHKNVPKELYLKIGVRFYVAYILIFLNAIFHGNGKPAWRGIWESILMCRKTHRKRKEIQGNIRVDMGYLSTMLDNDLPPNQTGLRKLRKFFTGK